ncbi:shikimate kinase [Streptomyces sp. NPDC059166]|uniref:shikimate kinase n=1 Tax=Streptomyces sp. NPDC059166 TaxID=3346752 RepID=UPI003685B5DB
MQRHELHGPHGDTVSLPFAVLIAPPGAGKSTVAEALANAAHVTVRDTDQDVVEETGASIAEIFAVYGEDFFRALEERAVRRAVAGHTGVIALGAGAVLSAKTRALLRCTPTVFLDVTCEDAVARLQSDTSRPLLAGDLRQRWARLAAARRTLYQEAARLTVTTHARTPVQVAEEVLGRLSSSPPC